MAGRRPITGLGLWRLPDGLARWPLLRVERRHGRGYSKSFELRGVDTERWGGCHALYLAIGLSAKTMQARTRLSSGEAPWARHTDGARTRPLSGRRVGIQRASART